MRPRPTGEAAADFRAKFQNLRLNQRIDANTQFISDPDWMQCAAAVDPHCLLASLALRASTCRTTTDMSALCLYWPHNGACMPFFWLPAEGLLDRDRKEGGHYRAWRDAGLLETTAGKAINFKAIIRRLAEIAAQFELKAVAYDRAFIKTFKAQCEEEGVTLPLIEYGQGYVSMSRPSRSRSCGAGRALSATAGILSCAGRSQCGDRDRPAGNRKVRRSVDRAC